MTAVVPDVARRPRPVLRMPRQPGRDARRRFGLVAYLVAGLALTVLWLAPLVWAAYQSFESPDMITSAPSLRGLTHLTTENYRGLLGGSVHILRYVGNSLVVSIGTAALTAVVATLAGYGFGRYRFRGHGIAFGVTLLGMMIPFQAILTPLFLELDHMHLANQLLGLVLIDTTFNLPFGVFVMRNSFAQVPGELVESARVDGASVLQTLRHVLWPLVLPAVATTVLYAFLFAWTEFLLALTLLTNDSRFTLPVSLLGLETGTFGQVNYGYLVAGAVIAMVPCVVLYVSLQRYYIQGLMSGAVKG